MCVCVSPLSLSPLTTFLPLVRIRTTTKSRPTEPPMIKLVSTTLVALTASLHGAVWQIGRAGVLDVLLVVAAACAWDGPPAGRDGWWEWRQLLSSPLQHLVDLCLCAGREEKGNVCQRAVVARLMQLVVVARLMRLACLLAIAAAHTLHTRRASGCPINTNNR